MKVSFIIILLISFNLFASEFETDSYLTIKNKVIEKVKKYGPKKTLLVLDIDNTTLQMSQNFGSDQWWNWQSGNCLGKEKVPSFCVTNNFSELLDIQGQIFALSNMKPTEKATVKTIKEIQAMGVKVILLTSRGPDFRNATERALNNNNLSFVDSAIGPRGGYSSTYIPYTLTGYSRYGLTKKEMKDMGHKKARPVSYMNGVFMTAGLNKGIMLKTLLKKTKSNFKAIIFADDHVKHTKRMQMIMSDDVDLTTYRYSKIDPQVEAFKKSDKNDAISAWNNFKSATAKVFK
jgi:hypothetical protein